MVNWIGLLWAGMALQALEASTVWNSFLSMLQVTPLPDWRAVRTADCAVMARAAVSRVEKKRAILGSVVWMLSVSGVWGKVFG